MDDAVRSQNIWLYHLGLVDHDGAVIDRQFQLLAIDGLRRRQLHDLSRGNITRYHVIEQDRLQLFLVLGLEKRLNCARRQLAEGFVGWSKHSEGSLAFQSVSQTGGLKRSGQRVEGSRGDRGVNDVPLSGTGGCR